MLWFGDDDSVSLLSSCGESAVVEGAGLLGRRDRLPGFQRCVARGVC